MDRKLIVTHHAPDLDAIMSVWLLKRFDAQKFALAHVSFVDPGSQISLEEAESLGYQIQEVTHVDTGLGEFDHHQEERSKQKICASSLVYAHVCQVHPELINDKALKTLVDFATEIDHFGEIYWPDANHEKYSLMLHELIKGIEYTDPHDDESQLHFGETCLDSAYSVLTSRNKALELIETDSIEFTTKFGKCLGIETSNDDTIKIAQKMGYQLVAKKDPKQGNIRIKMRPDTTSDLSLLNERIVKIDRVGTWYYHPGGKMLINGSKKHRGQKASPLSLSEVIELIKEIYG